MFIIKHNTIDCTDMSEGYFDSEMRYYIKARESAKSTALVL